MPKTFHRYELLQRIGAGGMAEVFLARGFAAHGQPVTVVIKRILPHLAGEEQFREMFVDEARIVASLRHPNIVRMLDLGRLDDQLFLAMEFVDGPDLDRLMEGLRVRRMRFPPGAAIHVVERVLRALHHAHSRTSPDGWPMDIVHRDVTASNVLISLGGTVKLSDFGISRARGRVQETTVRGKVKGKLRFMAPEQIREIETDARADVYAAGMLLHTLLGGRHVFDDDPLPQAIRRCLEGDVPPPSTLDPSIAPALDAVVMRAIRPQPEGRFASAEDFRAALEEVAGTLSIPIGEEELFDLVAANYQAPAPDAADRKPLSVVVRNPHAQGSESEFRTAGNEAAPLAAGAKRNAAVRRLEGHRGPVTALSAARPGWLVSGSEDGTVRSWSVEDRACVRVLDLGFGVRALRIADGAGEALALLEDGSHLSIDLERMETIARVDGLRTSAIGTAIGAGSAVTGGEDGAVRLWTFPGLEPVRELGRMEGPVRRAGLLAGALTAIACAEDRNVRLWSTENGVEVYEFQCAPHALEAAILSPCNGLLAAASREGMYVWDLVRRRELSAFSAGTPPAILAIHPRSTRIAAAGADGAIRLFELPTGEEVWTTRPHGKPVGALVVLEADVVSGSADHSIAISRFA